MRIDSTISAVVTGGASGLGFASVQALRAAGAKVAIFDMNPETGEKAAADTGSVFCQVDVTSDDSVAAGFARAAEANGTARILIACAGGGNAATTIRLDKATGQIKRFPVADFARVVTLNAVGTFTTITHFAAAAATLDPVDGERGAIVCTASVAAEDGQMGQAAYSAGKAAIIGMTLPVARDLSRFGIRINTILRYAGDGAGVAGDEGRARRDRQFPEAAGQFRRIRAARAGDVPQRLFQRREGPAGRGHPVRRPLTSWPTTHRR